MRRGPKLAAAALALMACASAMAADGDMLSAEEVVELLTGNTLTGQYSNGNPYSEYHAPNGVVYGHNNRRPVVNGCWDMRGNLACYYYAEDKQRGPFCWSFQRLGSAGYRATLLDKDHVQIVALLQKGNPHGHSHNGKPWACEPLQSRGPGVGDDRTRHAAR
jgi:hypothetical protein